MSSVGFLEYLDMKSRVARKADDLFHMIRLKRSPVSMSSAPCRWWPK